MANALFNQAFTLIELLVVIVIIGILAALSFPAFHGTTENAHQSQCLSNMKQIFSSIQNYLADNGNQLMQRYGAGPGATDGYDEALMRYIDSSQSTSVSTIARKIFTCPSEAQKNIQSYPSQPGYGLNWRYDNTMVTLVERASQTILLAETAGSDGSGSHRADRNWEQDGSIGRIDAARHQGKAHYLFFDGHVARLSFAETEVPLDPSNPNTDIWGTDFGKHGTGNE